MENRKKSTGKRLGGAAACVQRLFDVPMEGVSSLSTVELIGDREAVISGCLGILAYGENEILLRMKHGRLLVTGRDLLMESLTGGRITISGQITAVHTDGGSESC